MRLTLLLARRFVQVVGADDVAGQDGVPGLFGRDAAHVDHRIDTVQQIRARQLRSSRAATTISSPSPGCAHLGAMAQPQRVAIGLQARAQFAAEVAGGTGQQQALESDRGGRLGRASVFCGFDQGLIELPSCCKIQLLQSSVVVQLSRNSTNLADEAVNADKLGVYPCDDHDQQRNRSCCRAPPPAAHARASNLSNRSATGSAKAGSPAGAKLPTEAAVMREFGVSRTVVREALSKLQASGLVETRHGIGTFVVGLGDSAPFRIAPEQFATLRDVIAVLELRIGVETEAAALAAQRRNDDNLLTLRTALDGFAEGNRVGRRFGRRRFPVPPGNRPRDTEPAFRRVDRHARLDDHSARAARPADQQSARERREYLRRVNAEHESIYQCDRQPRQEGARAAMRTHLANSRERRTAGQRGRVDRSELTFLRLDFAAACCTMTDESRC